MLSNSHMPLWKKERKRAPARAIESISGWKKDLPTKIVKIVVWEILVGVLQIFQKGESIQYHKKTIVKRYVLTGTCLGVSQLLLFL